jgi:hypothetical protein
MLAGHFGQWGTGIHSKLFCGVAALTVCCTVRARLCLSDLPAKMKLLWQNPDRFSINSKAVLNDFLQGMAQ